MDAIARKALELSIRVWEEKLGTPVLELRFGPAHCPLCHMYNTSWQTQEPCLDCPIYNKTELRFCRGTPYEKVSRALERGLNNGIYDIIKEEIQFLKNLLNPEVE